MGRGLRWKELPIRLAGSAGSRSKYGNKKVVIDGHVFDSKKEGQCYHELKLREAAGEIRGLRVQVPFAIVVDNMHVCDYIADFVYHERIAKTGEAALRDQHGGHWEKRVADAKGMRTAIYRLKKTLMKAALKIEILEL